LESAFGLSYRLTAHRLRAWRRIATASADEANIDELERQSCEEIFLAREREYQDSYRQIPAFDDLAARYGDITNRRVYKMSRDVEGRWLDMHRRETGAAHPID
jgi:hypothetical protein